MAANPDNCRGQIIRVAVKVGEWRKVIAEDKTRRSLAIQQPLTATSCRVVLALDSKDSANTWELQDVFEPILPLTNEIWAKAISLADDPEEVALLSVLVGH